ncbi:MAG: hypothetical protein JNL70_00275 [Saprospiraceae bacterium]|nr:hypothetical protein [Saprospiraceae bacterium]
MSNYVWAFTVKDGVSAPIKNMTTAIGTGTAKAVGLQTALLGVHKTADKIAPSVFGIGSAFNSLSGVASTALAGLGLQQLGSSVIKTLSEFERMEAVLTNTLGSNSAARGVISGITEFAAKTPFQVDELTSSFVKLANQGFAPNLSELTKLGDFASSTGKGFDMLAEAFIDAQVGEFERLKEFGIQAKKSNGEVAFTFKNQTKVVKESAGEIRSYLLSLGNMTGVSGAMAAISATTGGQISNLSDQFDQLKLAIGTTFKPIIVDTLSILTTYLTNAATWVKANEDRIRDWMSEFKKVAITVGAVYVTYQTLTMGVAAYNAIVFIATNATSILSAAQAVLNAVMTANPIGIVVVGLAALVGAAVYAYQHFETFRGFIDGTWAALKVFGGYVYDWAIRPLLALGKILYGVFTADIGLIKQGMSDALDTLKANANNMLNAGRELGGAFTQGWNDGTKNFRLANPTQSVVNTDDMARYYNGGASTDPFKFAKNAVGGGKKLDLGVDKKEGKITGSGANVKNINVSIARLVEKIEIHVANATDKSGYKEIRELVARALIDATNDINYQ